jgi:nucleoside-diphosphate-sugar epimerase
MSTLIAGCGYVGGRLLRELANQGERVWGLRRTPTLADQARGGPYLQADVTLPDSLRDLPNEVHQIVYAVSPDGRDDVSYKRAYPLGLAHLRARYPTARFVFISSTAVYPQTQGETVDDDSETADSSFSASRLLEAEALLLEQDRSHVVFRCSGIYGPGRTRLLARLLHENLDERQSGIWTNRVHVDDIVGAVCWALCSQDQRGHFILSDTSPAQLGQIQEFVRAHPGAPDLLRPSGSRRAVTAMERKSRRIVPSRLMQTGFVHRYPDFRAGYGAILALPQRDEEAAQD